MTERTAPDTDVFTVSGADWEATHHEIIDAGTERLVVNFGPQHPSTHGVLRLILTLDGEQITEARIGVGYLHTGIEKTLEYRTWTQGVTFVTRADYLAPLFNETAYCLAVERLLDIEVPERAQVLRVLVMELNRISSHIIALGMSGLELGYGYTITLNGWREVEVIRDILENITGLRMNHAYVRPGGVVQDLPAGTDTAIRELLAVLPRRVREYQALTSHNPLWRLRTRGVGFLEPPACLALGVTGPPLRAAGLAWDLRKAQPYCGYETYEFDVPTREDADTFARWEVRSAEIGESAKIIEQCLDRLRPGPVMVDDPKIGWPARLALGTDGMGTSPDHVRHIMAGSMEALIHHFKLLTEGFRVPAGQVYAPIESPRGELAAHVISSGGTRPHRVHLRDPSFPHLQALPALVEGGPLSDLVPTLASMDTIMGGVDR